MLTNIFKVALGLFLLVSIAIFGEFHYWRNADTYPDWMSKHLEIPYKTINNSNVGSVIDYLNEVCGKNRGLMSVSHKKNGIFVRCDESLTATAWFDGVYKINVVYDVNLTKEGLKDDK